MPSFPSIVPFSTATTVTNAGDKSWRANLVQDYCVGAVPNGGYVASVLSRAVEERIAALGRQQKIISAQVQYVNRTQIGEAEVIIEDIKIGRATSTFHATLVQGGRKMRKCVLAYFICAATAKDGLTLCTGWELLPSPPPVHLERLADGSDPNWAPGASRVQIDHLASLGFVRAVEGVLESYYRRNPGRKGLEDAWVRLSSGEWFTDATLPLVADAKPYVVEAWRPKSSEKNGNEGESAPFSRDSPFWYPTLAMNVDIKKSLPEQGVEWLFLRTMTRKVDQGRLDLQVTILDQEGNLVALASHINLVLPAARNIGTKGGKEKL